MKMNARQKQIHDNYSDKPNWYGIEGVKFIYFGEWDDSKIEYDGRLLNEHIVEDTMWEEFKEKVDEGIIEVSKDCSFDMDKAFEKYMLDYSERAIELIELALNEDGVGMI